MHKVYRQLLHGAWGFIQSFGSPTDGTEAAKTDTRLEAEQQEPCSIDTSTPTGTHREDGAENTSDGSGEAEEA